MANCKVMEILQGGYTKRCVNLEWFFSYIDESDIELGGEVDVCKTKG